MQLAAFRRFPHLLDTYYRPATSNSESDQAKELALLNGVHRD